MIDNPGFAYPVGGTFDQAGRQFRIYAKETLNKLHYRVSVVKPFETGIDSFASPLTTERINKNFEALDEASVQYDVGANLLLHGHNMKWTLQYSTRPIYTAIKERNLIKRI